MQNGFGDHFLQDSYAAGHLINKTQIMMWFVNWLDAHPKNRKSWSSDQLTRYKLMANQQGGLGVSQGRYDKSQPGQIKGRDAQSVEDIQDDPSNDVDWVDRFLAPWPAIARHYSSLEPTVTNCWSGGRPMELRSRTA